MERYLVDSILDRKATTTKHNYDTYTTHTGGESGVVNDVHDNINLEGIGGSIDQVKLKTGDTETAQRR